jgi:hypothetical protein
MRALFTAVLSLAGLAFFAFAPFACDDTPRGDQGIDFLGPDGAYYNVPPSPEAGPDAHGPCTEDVDAGAICAELPTSGTPYDHFIACTGGQSPLELQCMSTGAAPVDGVATFCCTTGVL